MGRGTRQDIRGGWHHVMNRGADARPVFFTKRDGEAFETLLAEGSELSGVEVHAYCLMPNHFHLLVHCPEGGLSEFMQRVTSLYVRRINTRLGGDGALFRGRFRSILVDSPEYTAVAGRYIHRNPRDLSPPEGIVNYRWSSLRWYAGPGDAPAWLHTSTLLGMCPGHYVSYVDGELAVSTLRLDGLDDAIEMALDGTLDRRGITRLVLVALLERCHGDVHADIMRRLNFPTEAARRMATQRARRRLTTSPELQRTVQHVIELLSA